MEAINFLIQWQSWLLSIITAASTTMITYQSIRKAFTDDADVISDCNTKIKHTIIGTVIAGCLAGFIKFVETFYL